MGDKTSIQWTAGDDGAPGATWNPIAAFNKETGKRGWFCTKVSPGCANCYAERFNRPRGNGLAYTAGNLDKVEFRLMQLDQPLRWKRPRRIFVESMSDLFHDGVSDVDLAKIFAVMAAASHHQFLVLTKRIERALDWFAMVEDNFLGYLLAGEEDPTGKDWELPEWPLPNVQFGVSVEDQKTADERIPALLRISAAVRFLSCEPMLEPIDLKLNLFSEFASPEEKQQHVAPRRRDLIHQVIIGGESGPGARPFNLAWARSIIEQCRQWGTAPFVKQLGAVPMIREDEWRALNPTPLLNANNRNRVPEGYVPLRFEDKKGGEIEEWPEDLRVREFPKVLERATSPTER